MNSSMFLLLLFGVFSLGQLGRVSFLNQEINFYLYEPLLVIGFFYFFIKYRFKPLKLYYPIYKVIFFFMASLLFSFFVNFFSFTVIQNLISSLYFIRLAIYLLFFCYLFFHLKQIKLRFNNELLFLFIAVLITSFIQYFFYPDLQNLIYLGWDPHYNRMFGVFFDTSTAAAVFGLSFLFMITEGRFLLAILSLTALVLTFARSGYITLLVSFFYYYVSKKMFKLGILFAAIFIFLLVLVPKQFGQGVGLTRSFSISSRIANYQQGIKIWLRSPIFGVGYNRIRYIKEQIGLIDKGDKPYHSAASISSSYLMVLINGGAVGLILFISSIFRIIRINRKSSVIVLFVSLLSFFDNIILHPFIMFLFGSLLVNINLSGKLRK